MKKFLVALLVASALSGAAGTSYAAGAIGATVESDGNCPVTQVVIPGTNRDVYETQNGALCIGTVDVTVSNLYVGPYTYKHIATSTTTLVKSGAGILHSICINTLGTVASTVEFDDALTHTTPVIGILNSLTTGQACYAYDVSFTTGLSVTTTGTVAPDITVSYH